MKCEVTRDAFRPIVSTPTQPTIIRNHTPINYKYSKKQDVSAIDVSNIPTTYRNAKGRRAAISSCTHK